MPAPRLFALLSLAFCLAVGLTAAVDAAPTRFVASTGKDTNDCTRAAPCLTMQRGVNQTPAGGELIVLDSGAYGPSLDITKSVTIVADGVTATLSSAGGITINGGGAVVTLRGLSLNGGKVGANAIKIKQAAAVHIEDCTVERYTGDGIILNTAINTDVFVSNTVARDNGNSGIIVHASGAQVEIENSRFERNGYAGAYLLVGKSSITRSVASGNPIGIYLYGGTTNITDTVVSDNASIGFFVTGANLVTLASSVARGSGNGLEIDSGSAITSDSVFTYNGTGIYIASGGGASALINNSVFTNNGIGVKNDGALYTRQNNTNVGNTADFSGTAPSPRSAF